MKKMMVLSLVLLPIALFSAKSTHSQTRCPVGTQAGSTQCLPDDEGSAPPRPTGEWLKTWGAIVHADGTSEAWASTGMLSEKEAEMDAIDQCQSAGFKNCIVTFTYRNQCVAAAAPVGVASGPDLSAAKRDVIAACEKKTGRSCSVIYTDCTKPIFKKY